MALTTITIPQIAVEKTNLVGTEMLIARDVETGQDVRIPSDSLSGALIFTGDGTDRAAEFQAFLDAAQDGARVIIKHGTVLGIGAECSHDRPIKIENYGTIKLLGTAPFLGAAFLTLSASNAHFHNYGLIDGDGTNWSGVIFTSTVRLYGNNLTCGFVQDMNPGSLSVSQFIYAMDCVEGGHIYPGYATNCGGQNLYTQFCKNLTGQGFVGKDVGYTTVNSAANLDCTFNGMQGENVGYFGMKAGYGLVGVISNHIAPTSTTFSIAATAQNKKVWSVGQHFLITFNTSSCIFPIVKSVVDNGAYLTITTAKPMEATPSAGMELEFVDNTIWNNPVVRNTGDNGFDFNIVGGGGSINYPRSYFCGHFTGLGNHLMLGASIWIGADPQGANEGYRINNFTVNHPESWHSAGSSVEIFGIGENVWVNHPRWTECNELKEAPGTMNPQYGGVELNRLSFGAGRHFGVIEPVGTSANGYGVLLGGGLYVKYSGGNVRSGPVGLVIQEAVGGVEIHCPTITTSLSGSSGFQVRDVGTPTGISITGGGNITSNGAGSMALNIESTAASDFFISRETALSVEPAGTRIVNNTVGLTVRPEHGNTIPNSVSTPAIIGQPSRRYIADIVANGSVYEFSDISADNGTSGAIVVHATAWTAAGGKHTFQVVAQGDVTPGDQNVSFTTLGTPVTPFLTAGNFTIVTSVIGIKLVYTNATGADVRFTGTVDRLPRT